MVSFRNWASGVHVASFDLKRDDLKWVDKIVHYIIAFLVPVCGLEGLILLI